MARILSTENNELTLPRFTTDGEIIRRYRQFNAIGTELTVRLLPPAVGDDSDAMSHFQAIVTDMFECDLRNCRDSVMVGLAICNEVNMQDNTIGISFRGKGQLSEKIIWSVFDKVAHSNVRYIALDKLVVVVHAIKMPVGFRKGVKSKVRPLSVMAHLKRSIIEVKAETNCLAHALIIARITYDPNYTSYRKNTSSGTTFIRDDRY